MDLIKEYPNSLDPIFCQKIIDMFELEDRKHIGTMARGVDTTVKQTTDFSLLNNDEKWKDIYNTLVSSLSNNLKEYIQTLQSRHFLKYVNNVHDSGFKIQKYTKTAGFYKYHDDASINANRSSYRIITYIWYLNDVLDGGETEFFETHRITPKTGKLLLFPATWTYPHSALVPISSDKYIVTGWISVDYNIR